MVLYSCVIFYVLFCVLCVLLYDLFDVAALPSGIVCMVYFNFIYIVLFYFFMYICCLIGGSVAYW